MLSELEYFQWKKKQGKGLKKIFQRLPIALVQVKADCRSKNLINEIRQIT